MVRLIYGSSLEQSICFDCIILLLCFPLHSIISCSLADPYFKFKKALSPTPVKSSAPQGAITPMNMTALSWMSNSTLSPGAGSPLNDSMCLFFLFPCVIRLYF